LKIKEKFIGKREYSLHELNEEIWSSILHEAILCLDEDRAYKARKRKQLVTLVSNGQVLERDISPHLNIYKKVTIDGNIEENIKRIIDDLKPIYQWVLFNCNQRACNIFCVNSKYHNGTLSP
jgi:hypothetical protein